MRCAAGFFSHLIGHAFFSKNGENTMRWWVVFLVLLSAAACHAEERTVEADVPQRVDDLQSLSSSLVPINDFVYRSKGRARFS